MADSERTGVSAALDEMTCDVIGACLDELAQGGRLDVVVCVEDGGARRAMVSIEDDGEEACLAAARSYVSQAAEQGVDAPDGDLAVRYAVAMLGFVQDDDGVGRDALLVSFGEQGAPCGYSAFVLVDGIGEGDGFMWSDPEPAGEEPLLL